MFGLLSSSVESLWPRLARLGLFLLVVASLSVPDRSSADEGLRIAWEKNYLTISGEAIKDREIVIHYLEAYCRDGSTDRDWHETVIGHTAELTSADTSAKSIHLRDTLRDGVKVEHVITARDDEIDFQLVAHNPTKEASRAHWAQPCIRIDKFTGCDPADSRQPIPPYARKCFLFLDGKLSRLPTQPWADQARYIPGQVYCPPGVDRNDVNPRPVSSLVPSSGLCGCFSADEKQIMAVAWQPYQEIFQGVITCLHSDFRIGGLKPGERKTIRGKIYIVPANVEALVARYERDFKLKKP